MDKYQLRIYEHCKKLLYSNHVLKQATEWESRCMLDLILILHNVVRSQQDDPKRALIGMGNYQLAKGYVLKIRTNFNITQQPFVWDNKSPEQKNTH